MLIRRHVIGPDGIRLQMNVLEPDGRPDLAANKIIETAWRDWGRKGSPTPCGRLSWWGVECQITTALAREGVGLIRQHRGRGFGRHSYQVQPLPLDLLATDLTAPLEGGNYIEMGVECNPYGRPLAFHMWNAPMDAGHLGQYRRRVRVPAEDLILVVIPEEVGELLNVPRTATALRMMNLAEKFQKSAMTAANYGAAQMIFFETEAGGASPIAPTDPEDDELGDVEQIDPGTTAYLPPGVTARPHTPHYPEAAVEPFLRSLSTSMASSLGVSYETVTSDLSRANFSSLRAGKGEERDEWRMVQRAVFEGLHEEVFRAWLPLSIASGRVGNLPLYKLDKFQAAEWRPRGWPSVNPKDDATASQIELALGLKSRTEIAAQRGRRFSDVIAERAAEEQAMRDAGLDPGQPGPPPASPPDKPEKED